MKNFLKFLLLFLLQFFLFCLVVSKNEEANQELLECIINVSVTQNWLQTISCVQKYWKKCSKNQLTSVLYDEYDITINKDWEYLRALGKDGWKVKIQEKLISNCLNKYNTDKEESECIINALNRQGVLVAWMGSFNSGKTFCVNLITKKKFPNGFDSSGETKGINMIFDSHGASNVIHIDTPGQLRSVAPEDLQDRFMTDKFLQDFMPEIANAIIFVVDILTTHEQVLIELLTNYVATLSNGDNPKYLVILHNFKNLLTKSDVDEHIESDIVRAFKATPNIKTNPQFWTHKYHRFTVYHYILAQEGSEAAETWNERTIKSLQNWLAGPMADNNISPIQRTLAKLSSILPEYFPADAVDHLSILPQPDKTNIYDIFKRMKMWAFGKFQYVDVPISDVVFESQHDDNIPNGNNNNNNDNVINKQIGNADNSGPYDLEFIPVKNENNVNGIIRLRNQRELQYCTINDSVGVKPQCRPDVHCAILTSKDTWILQCALPNIEITSNKEELSKKIMILRDENESRLYIIGHMPSTWGKFASKDGNLKLEHQDAKMYGQVSRVFRIPNNVNARWDSRITSYKEGILSIIVPTASKYTWGDDESWREDL